MLVETNILSLKRWNSPFSVFFVNGQFMFMEAKENMESLGEERELLRTIKARRGKLCAVTRKKNEIINMVKINKEKDVVQRHCGGV